MPLLRKDGRVPLSVAGLMRHRLDVLESRVAPEVRDAWWNNCFDTGDAPAYDTHGKVKVVLDAEPLRQISSQSKLFNGALVLEDGVYAQLPGPEFSAEEKAQYTGRYLANEQEVLENPF